MWASVELRDIEIWNTRTPLPAYWENAFHPFFTPTGRPIPRGKATESCEEAMYLLSAGEMVGLTGAHAARYHARPDIVHLPPAEAPVLRWGLVWRTETENDLVRALAQTVRDLGTARL